MISKIVRILIGIVRFYANLKRYIVDWNHKMQNSINPLLDKSITWIWIIDIIVSMYKIIKILVNFIKENFIKENFIIDM